MSDGSGGGPGGGSGGGPGGGSGGRSGDSASEARRAVLREFHGNRTAMAAEIVRLRAQLDDARAELSRLAARGLGGVVIPGGPGPATAWPAPRRPVGFRSHRALGDHQQVG